MACSQGVAPQWDRVGEYFDPRGRILANTDAGNPAQRVRSQLPKSPTGIVGFDEITDGGLPTGRPTLVCGPPGCGQEPVLAAVPGERSDPLRRTRSVPYLRGEPRR